MRGVGVRRSALPDVLVNASTTDCLSALDAVRALGDAGVPVVNPPDAAEASGNNFRAAIALRAPEYGTPG
ncbi:MAG: hypothetical protein M3P91_04385 [Actinomycetota bacterium]|nr:hypothetical protein [Actinomycetota bacterium]